MWKKVLTRLSLLIEIYTKGPSTYTLVIHIYFHAQLGKSLCKTDYCTAICQQREDLCKSLV